MFSPKSIITHLVISFSLVTLALGTAFAQTVPSAKPASGASVMRAVLPDDTKAIATLNSRYQAAVSVQMDVAKTFKSGTLGGERKSKGKAWLKPGKIRMELEGSEKTLLVVNKKNLWAVTFPPPEFKDAAIQVIKGETDSKKARTQAMVGLLTQGGFLKQFKPIGAQGVAGGETTYFLQPEKEQTDFKRAQMRVSKDGKSIAEIRFWDSLDNETSFEFSNVVFGKKVDEKLFTYAPPANADVMNL